MQGVEIRSVLRRGKQPCVRLICPKEAAHLTGNHRVANGSRTSGKPGNPARCPRETGKESGQRVTPSLKNRRNCYGPCLTKLCQGIVRHPPSQPKASVPVRKRPDKEVKLSPPPAQAKGPLFSPAKAKSVTAQPQEMRSEGKEGRHQNDSADEHHPPPRPFAHPKKCPVQ